MFQVTKPQLKGEKLKMYFSGFSCGVCKSVGVILQASNTPQVKPDKYIFLFFALEALITPQLKPDKHI